MIRNRLISFAIVAAMLVSLSGAALAQEEVSLEGTDWSLVAYQDEESFFRFNPQRLVVLDGIGVRALGVEKERAAGIFKGNRPGYGARNADPGKDMLMTKDPMNPPIVKGQERVARSARHADSAWGPAGTDAVCGLHHSGMAMNADTGIDLQEPR